MNQKRLKELLNYNPETGIFTRLTKSAFCVEIGDVAGGKCKNGYILISLDGKQYSAHRLAWLYMTGSFPKNLIDHKDSNKQNNIFSNLREATYAQNIANKKSRSKSGFKGVTWWARDSKWKAQMQVDGVNKHLGYFDTPEQAHEAYKKYAIVHIGEFFCA
jgi:hypothetical protein